MRTDFEQACETARSYSTLRFVMFTVFITILGALLVIEVDDHYQFGPPAMVVTYRLTAIALALLFSRAEWRVSQLIDFYQRRAAFDFRPHYQLPLVEDHQRYVVRVKRFMMAPLLMAAVFWAVRLWTYWSEWAPDQAA